ncbi:MAG: Rnase Y domain-containing protein, partial [Candidatus Binataceae bacterium]
MEPIILIVAILLALIAGGAIVFFLGKSKPAADVPDLRAAQAQSEESIREAQGRSELAVKEAELKVGALVREAELKAKDLVKEAEVKAKEVLIGARADAERENRERRKEITAIEQKLEAREETFEKRQEAFERRETDLNRRDQGIRTREKTLGDKEVERQKLVDEARSKLEAVAGLTREEAKRSLMDEMTGQARTEASKQIRVIEEEAREESDRRAKRIVSIAIERLAGEFVTERTVATIALPNDEMKGRIIGREGRNIRAFELATGVDVIIDDTPDSVVVSCFDPVRREIARLALEKLVSDGRIHPGRIEEVVNKSRKEVDAQIIETGEQAAYDAGVHGLHPELIKLVGRMRWRTSYGQNILQHSKEVAWLAGIMAGELGLDVAMAKRGAL